MKDVSKQENNFVAKMLWWNIAHRKLRSTFLIIFYKIPLKRSIKEYSLNENELIIIMTRFFASHRHAISFGLGLTGVSNAHSGQPFRKNIEEIQHVQIILWSYKIHGIFLLNYRWWSWKRLGTYFFSILNIFRTFYKFWSFSNFWDPPRCHMLWRSVWLFL